MSTLEPSWLEELFDFLRIPSVSADPVHAADVRRAGEWVRDYVRRIGGEAELERHGGSELVIGEIPASTGEGAPTVLLYGHFDVQPPTPLELWESDPFELTLRGEWAYGRGVADDKGQLFILLKAAELLAREGRLPVNLRVACDGEEEIGGHSIVDFLAADERGADACVIFDGGMTRRDKPEFGIATRGLVAFDVVCTTGERDLHSGLYGGAALNAIHALIQALSGLLARNGRLPEPLRAGIAPPTDEELASWRQMPPGAEELAKAQVSELDEHAAEEFWYRTWAEPSLDVNGIIGGKPGLRNTTLSVKASAEFTIRLAPGQDGQAIGEAAERLLRESAPPGASLETRWDATPPGLIPADSLPIRIGLDAFERAFGVRPLLVRSGGTLPIVPALVDKGIPTIVSGFAMPESNVHSPNERLLLEYFPRGVATAQELYLAFAALR